jgi:hypothetical protein
MPGGALTQSGSGPRVVRVASADMLELLVHMTQMQRLPAIFGPFWCNSGLSAIKFAAVQSCVDVHCQLQLAAVIVLSHQSTGISLPRLYDLPSGRVPSR